MHPTQEEARNPLRNSRIPPQLEKNHAVFSGHIVFMGTMSERTKRCSAGGKANTAWPWPSQRGWGCDWGVAGAVPHLLPGPHVQPSPPACLSATQSFSSFYQVPAACCRTDHGLCSVCEHRGGGFSSREGALWLHVGLLSSWRRQPHSSTLAWKIPRTEGPDGLQSMGSLRVGHDWATSLSLFTFMHWRRKWQPTLVFLPGESQGWQSLVGFRLWGHTESDTTEVT